MSDGDLLYEVKQAAAWMTINREARGNAVSLELIDRFFRHLDKAEADEEVRVVCITGAGDKILLFGSRPGDLICRPGLCGGRTEIRDAAEKDGCIS